jgi:hypothetical protein
MPTSLPTQRGIDPAVTTPLPTVDATLRLSARTLSWLARRHPPAARTAGCGLLLTISRHPARPATTTRPNHRRLAGPANHRVIAQEVCGD